MGLYLVKLVQCDYDSLDEFDRLLVVYGLYARLVQLPLHLADRFWLRQCLRLFLFDPVGRFDLVLSLLLSKIEQPIIILLGLYFEPSGLHET